MKITKMAFTAAIAACLGGSAFAQAPVTRASDFGYYAEQASPAADYSSVIPASCGCSDAPISSGCDISAGGCDSSGCDGLGGGGGLFGLGLLEGGCGDEPFALFPNGILGLNVGGWTAIGYHSARTNSNFNNRDSEVQLHQQWLYAEKVADGSCGLGLGGRIDYLYGTDAQDTQAFGIPNNHWDNGWNNGSTVNGYGHAIPQLYAEAAYGAMSVKAGHFFTIVGNEVVQATGNFFYSRQFTFYNSEPFTHTGVLTSYALDDETTLWNGYVMGWDSGFEDNGDAYIGGFSRTLTDNVSLIYTSTLGRFNENFLGTGSAERGQVHSMILSVGLTDNLKYINQNDYLFTNAADGTGLRNTFGSIHYLIYSLTDRVALGSRTEWYNISSESGAIGAIGPVRNADLYNQTAGINYAVNSNLMLRPEVRWVWDKERLGFNENGGSSQTFFGADAVFTF